MSPVPPWKLGVHRRRPGRKLPERCPLCSSLRVAQQVGFGSGQGAVNFPAGAAPGGVRGPVTAPGGWPVTPCLGPRSDPLDLNAWSAKAQRSGRMVLRKSDSLKSCLSCAFASHGQQVFS